jgi:hypothetical protein
MPEYSSDGYIDYDGTKRKKKRKMRFVGTLTKA